MNEFTPLYCCTNPEDCRCKSIGCESCADDQATVEYEGEPMCLSCAIAAKDREPACGDTCCEHVTPCGDNACCPEELGEPLPSPLRTTDEGLRIVDEDALLRRTA